MVNNKRAKNHESAGGERSQGKEWVFRVISKAVS